MATGNVVSAKDITGYSGSSYYAYIGLSGADKSDDPSKYVITLDGNLHFNEFTGGGGSSASLDGTSITDGDSHAGGAATGWAVAGHGAGTTTRTVDKTKQARSISYSCVQNVMGLGKSTATESINVPALPSYNVTYNANGGSGAPAGQTKWYGEDLTLQSGTPTKTGYSFAGWNTEADGTGTNYSAGETYTGNEALTLYAKWTANAYTVTWNANGGTVSPASQTVYYDSAIGTLPTPTRAGYEFLGWFTSSSGGTQITTSTKPQGDKTYYAQWKAQGAAYVERGLEFKRATCFIATENGWKPVIAYVAINKDSLLTENGDEIIAENGDHLKIGGWGQTTL